MAFYCEFTSVSHDIHAKPEPRSLSLSGKDHMVLNLIKGFSKRLWELKYDGLLIGFTKPIG